MTECAPKKGVSDSGTDISADDKRYQWVWM